MLFSPEGDEPGNEHMFPPCFWLSAAPNSRFLLLAPPPHPHRERGTSYVLHYFALLGAAGETPIFNPQISVPEHIILTNDKNISFQSITILVARQILHFCRSVGHRFQKVIYVQAVHRRPRPASAIQTSIHGQRMRIFMYI